MTDARPATNYGRWCSDVHFLLEVQARQDGMPDDMVKRVVDWARTAMPQKRIMFDDWQSTSQAADSLYHLSADHV